MASILKKRNRATGRSLRNDGDRQGRKRTTKRGTPDRSKTVRANAGKPKQGKARSGRAKTTRSKSPAPGSAQARAARRPTIGPRATGIWILLMFVFIGELFFYTWCRVQSVRVGYELAQAADNQKSLREMRKNLKIEVVRLKSPERLAVLAKQLRLKRPTAKQLIVIR